MDQAILELTVEQAERVWALEFLGPQQVIALVAGNQLQGTVEALIRFVRTGSVAPAGAPTASAAAWERFRFAPEAADITGKKPFHGSGAMYPDIPLIGR